MKRFNWITIFVALFLVSLASCLAGCALLKSGGSPVAVVATLGEPGVEAVADVRSNLNTTVVRAKVAGVIGLRDADTGAWLMPPRTFAAGEQHVWRREPQFSQGFTINAPLPAWVALERGLWRDGEAAELGYTFEVAP